MEHVREPCKQKAPILVNDTSTAQRDKSESMDGSDEVLGKCLSRVDRTNSSELTCQSTH